MFVIQMKRHSQSTIYNSNTLPAKHFEKKMTEHKPWNDCILYICILFL